MAKKRNYNLMLTKDFLSTAKSVIADYKHIKEEEVINSKWSPEIIRIRDTSDKQLYVAYRYKNDHDYCNVTVNMIKLFKGLDIELKTISRMELHKNKVKVRKAEKKEIKIAEKKKRALEKKVDKEKMEMLKKEQAELKKEVEKKVIEKIKRRKPNFRKVKDA